MEGPHHTIGQVVDYCLKKTTEEWFRQHGGYRSREEAFANDFRLVSATVEKRPGGRLRIHVGVVTRDRNTTMSNYTPFRLRGSQGWVEEEELRTTG